MSKLIQMRNRIQTIETIRKVTDVMRIISMSAHSRLKVKQEPLSEYLNTLKNLLAKVQRATPTWKHEQLMPTENDRNPLIIIIGSQKGLCGGFNTQLSKILNDYISHNPSAHYRFSAVGKKPIEYLINNHPDKLVCSFPVITSRNFLTIAQELTDMIMTATPAYTSVVIISNVFKNFFTQKATITQLIPFDPTSSFAPLTPRLQRTGKASDSAPSSTENSGGHGKATSDKTADRQITADATPPTEGYMWDETPSDILNKLAIQYIEAQFQHLIFQSLLSEHAARFLSMDNSTRNANTLLTDTKLEYNKIRQAKITTEITELTGNF